MSRSNSFAARNLGRGLRRADGLHISPESVKMLEKALVVKTMQGDYEGVEAIGGLIAQTEQMASIESALEALNLKIEVVSERIGREE